MRSLLVAMAFLASLPVHAAEDPPIYLDETQALIAQGKHHEALERFVSFLDHLHDDESITAMESLRPTLTAWKQLGDTYPPALKALLKIRDHKAKLLVGNAKGDPELFGDIVEINIALGQQDKTIALFALIDKRQPNHAKDYWYFIKDTLIDAKQYALVRKYLGDPVKEFEELKGQYDHLTLDNDSAQRGHEQVKTAIEKHFVDGSMRLIRVSLGIRNPKAAREIQKRALAEVDDPRLRDAIPSSKSTTQTKTAPSKTP